MNLDSFLGFSHSLLNNPAFVMKTNPDATSYFWASNHSASESTSGAILLNGSEVAFTGKCGGSTFPASSTFTWGTQSITAPGANQGHDVLLARFNSTTGACLSLNKIISSNATIDFGAAIAKDVSGDYIIGGGFAGTLYDVNNSTVVNEGGDSDFFITKFSTQPCLPLSSESFEEESLNIFPNPVKDIFTISVKENTNYQLYTLTGILVKKGNINISDNTIIINELVTGCYLLQLHSESGKSQTLKVIKE